MIYLDNYAISLDRKESNSDIDFISHAHSDHTSAAKSSKSVIASRETAELLKAIKDIDLKKHDGLDGISLLDSGHMLGSKQIRIESSNGENVTYTGDFMLQRSETCSPVQILETDTLIIDSTYCTPEIKFGRRDETECAIQKWVTNKQKQGSILFGVHAAGKAQEITRILNNIGIVPATTKKISAINKVYRENGVGLKYTSAYDDAYEYESAMRGNFVGVVESHRLDDLAAMLGKLNNRRVYRAVATGWASIFRFNTDVQFPLSDHADFRQSVYYIEAASPKRVLTYGSNAETFARNLARQGYNAEPFRTEIGLQYRVIEGNANLQ